MIKFAILAGMAGAVLLATKNAGSDSSAGAAPAASPDTLPDYNQTGFITLFNTYGPQYGVPPLWLQAFCTVESNMGQDPSVMAGALSSDGQSKGIMQLTLPTANDYESVSLDDLNNPDTSVRIASKFIQALMGQFDSTDPRYTEWVVKSYNQGAGNTKKEIAGTGGGYANAYWSKWGNAYQALGGDPNNYTPA